MHHSKAFQKLWHAKCRAHLPQAVLLLGEKGTQKAACAEYFTCALFCPTTTPEGKPCQSCQSCQQIANNLHPNIRWMTTEADNQTIKIDQIRSLNDFVYQTTLEEGMRVVIIHPADHMTITAANALLKTLEEPPQNTLFILISDQRGRYLPATIVSRCQRIVFPSLHQHEQLKMLQKQPARQAVFTALVQLADRQGNPLHSAEHLQHHDPLHLLDYFLSWIVDVLRLQLNGESERIMNQDYVDHLNHIKEKTHLKHNVKLMEYLQHLRTQLCEGMHLNKQMMLEAIFIRWMECASCSL